MTSLTHADAQARANLLTVHEYDIHLDFTTGDRYFGSVTKVRFTASGPTTFVDVSPDRLRRVELNGRELDVASVFDPASGRLRLTDLQTDNELLVDAVMAYSHDGEGMHRHVDPADGLVYLYAMSFLDAAPRWFACFDQPDLKAPVALTVRCPDDWTVAGNGPATELGPGRWQIAATHPLATYFTTVVAGPYHQVRSRHRSGGVGIELVLHARQSLAEHLDREADDILGHTRRSFDALHGLFGVGYPWGEYHQAFVPEFNAGAMENPGCVTLRDNLVFRSRATDAERADRAATIAHEMAHMWFGDLVTMRWWDDLWLNESFAEYLGHRAVGEHTWPAFGIERKSWGYRADRRPSTHPVAGNGAPDAASALLAFDGISYAKGASVLRQLAAHLGDDAFLAGLRRYVHAHAHGNAELADLLGAWAALGHDLTGWADAWLRTSGVDELRVEGGDLVRRSPDDTRRPHTVTVVALDDDGSELDRRAVTVDGDRVGHGLADGGLVVADADDQTWAKIVPADWSRVPDLLGRVAAPSTRVALWNALLLAVADADIDPRLAVRIVTTALPVETDDAVLTVVGGWAVRELVGARLDDGPRVAALADLHAAAGTVLTAAEPGSSRQLVAARWSIATSADPASLRGWLAGGAPAGLVVDADLRWTLLRRLSVLGATDAAEIDAEAARDHSSQGSVHAAWCRAARPDPATKASAWARLMGDPDCPNYELYALAEGFWQPDQDAVTAPYVARYFAEIAGTATLRTGWVVARTAQLAYPWTAVSAQTLAATDALLADPDLPAGLRRSLTDAGDDLRRAHTCRTRFGPHHPG